MSDSLASRILAELHQLRVLVEDQAALLARLESGQELIRRHVVQLGQRVSVLECDALTPQPQPYEGD